MKSFIWDLDGTLINSYDVIVKSLYTSFKKIGINITQSEINKRIIETSVSTYLKNLETELNTNLDFVRNDYLKVEETLLDNIKLMPNVKQILADITSKGNLNFIFTHRGESLKRILKNNGIDSYFKDIINPQMGFKRKPSGEGIIYLCDKYSLDKNNCYYVGDRILDVLAAKDAGVKSILYLEKSSYTKPSGKEDYIVSNLLEINDILDK